MRPVREVAAAENLSIGLTPTRGFFSGLSAAALRALDRLRFTTTFPEGAILFWEGEVARGVFVLRRGHVKLSMASSEGKILIVRLAAAGDVLGLQGAVAGTRYELTAETLETCEVDFVRRDDFLRYLQQYPQASINAAQQLSHHYQVACEQIRSLGLSRSVPEKLARFLLGWSVDGQRTEQGIRVNLSLTHEEIAQVIGASRETVTRALSKFRAKQLAALRRSTLLIRDPAALKSFISS